MSFSFSRSNSYKLQAHFANIKFLDILGTTAKNINVGSICNIPRCKGLLVCVCVCVCIISLSLSLWAPPWKKCPRPLTTWHHEGLASTSDPFPVTSKCMHKGNRTVKKRNEKKIEIKTTVLSKNCSLSSHRHSYTSYL